VTVDVDAGYPFTFVVIFAPTPKSPSMFAASITLPCHVDGVVQTCQIVDTGALQDDEPAKDRDALMEPIVPLTPSAIGRFRQAASSSNRLRKALPIGIQYRNTSSLRPRLRRSAG
jgi:hypothetical protein